jgi:hypothetical protein
MKPLLGSLLLALTGCATFQPPVQVALPYPIETQQGLFVSNRSGRIRPVDTRANLVKSSPYANAIFLGTGARVAIVAGVVVIGAIIIAEQYE